MRIRDAIKVQVGDTLIVKNLKDRREYKMRTGTKFPYYKEFHENPVVERTIILGKDYLTFVTEQGWHIPYRLVAGFTRRTK